VAYACLEIFLQTNGMDVAATNEELERFIYANLEGGTFRKDVLEQWLREHTGPLE
jgi:death-on-curing protein